MFWGRNMPGEQWLHFLRSPLEAPGVLVGLQTAETAIASATGGTGVGTGKAAHCTKPPGGNVGLWQLDSQVGHLSLLLPCFLLEQTQGLLAHDKVSMGIVAVVILFQVFQGFSGPALPGGIIKDPSLSRLLNP